jgi:beta-xylosidase
VKTYRNPVHPEYFADPFVWRHGDVYYAVGTGAREASGHVGDRVFPLLGSDDLVSWKPLQPALLRLDPALGDSYWAPEVAFESGTFFLYYSVGFQDREHQLRVAASDRPEGPYRDQGPLLEPGVCPFAIDPHPFRDDDGRFYLFYARDFLDTDSRGGTRAGTALVVRALEGMTRLAADEHLVMRARWDWQRFQADRPMYGGTYDWHTLEGPSVLKHDGRYHCFYSGGRWETTSYGVDYGTAAKVTGPYDDDNGGVGPRVLRTVADRALGPGHNSFVRGPDGHADWVVYHAWDVAMTARRMCIDPLLWTPEGPRCDGPTFQPRPLGELTTIR